MPDVPNVPGVPSLSSYLDSPLALLAFDTFLPLIGIQNVWGIFFNFIPVLSSLTPLVDFSIGNFEYKRDWSVSDYPVEEGGFQSYDKVQHPFDIRMRVKAGGSEANRQALLTAVDAAANGLPTALTGIVSGVVNSISSAFGLPSGVLSSFSALASGLALYDVVTPERIYHNCNITHYDFKRTATEGAGLIVVDIWLVEIRVTATAAFSNTQQPQDAGVVGLGVVQASQIPQPQPPGIAPFPLPSQVM